jgi:hypothetical protein
MGDEWKCLLEQMQRIKQILTPPFFFFFFFFFREKALGFNLHFVFV